MTAHQDFAERPQLSPQIYGPQHYAHAAAMYLLDQLREQGHECQNIPEAFDRKLLTDDQWCDALELFRIPGGGRNHRARAEARIARAQRLGRALAERRGYGP